MPNITKKAEQAIKRRRTHLKQCTNEVKEIEYNASAENASKCQHCATAWAANQLLVLELQDELKKLNQVRVLLG